jgi:hypothetical protein
MTHNNLIFLHKIEARIRFTFKYIKYSLCHFFVVKKYLVYKIVEKNEQK